MTVAVTGVGVIGSHGAGLEGVAAALAAGAPPTAPVDRSGGYHRETDPALAALVPDAATRPWIPPLAARRMCRPSRFAVAAARAALKDAAVAEAGGGRLLDAERTSVCLGTAWGSTAYTLRLLQQLRDEGPLAVSPFLFTETVANAPAGQVAIAVGARGSNLTLCQREASAVAAICRGAAQLESGRATRVLAGAADECSPILHGVLGQYGAITAGDRGRPLAASRDGVLLGEGANVLVLESAAAAHARGVPVRAHVVAHGRANDPTATATDWGTGGTDLAAEVRDLLTRRGIGLETLDLVVAGCAGSRRGDAAEAGFLHALFRGETPPVVAPKGAVGEYGGAFLAAALIALEGGETPACPGDADPRLPLALASGTMPAPRRVLVTSLASGGPAAWMVLERP